MTYKRMVVCYSDLKIVVDANAMSEMIMSRKVVNFLFPFLTEPELIPPSHPPCEISCF